MCSMAWFSDSSTAASFPFDHSHQEEPTLPDPTSCARFLSGAAAADSSCLSRPTSVTTSTLQPWKS